MKLLSGRDLAGFIKERQARQVRALIQAHHTKPRLVIIQTKDDPVINTYVRLKKEYGKDILIDVEAPSLPQAKALAMIEACNKDPLTHGIIVQLPLQDPTQTKTVIEAVIPKKDVDGLGVDSPYNTATPTAINWLLTGYNIDMQAKKIVIVGRGRLVGEPLYRLWQQIGHDVTVLDDTTQDLASELKTADIIVTATGSPGLIKSEMIPVGAVVVDAGTSSENGKTTGDVAPEVYERSDLIITPKIGGVGPLTVAALFDNVIRAASSK